MLSQDPEQALPLWTRAHSPKSARHLAALVLCESLAGGCQWQFAPGDELRISQEFLKWYQLLIGVRANELAARLNGNMEQLRVVLPSFVKMWDVAAKEAAQAVSA
jgi:hypothetical protein